MVMGQIHQLITSKGIDEARRSAGADKNARLAMTKPR
jgi:hypothetical protein